MPISELRAKELAQIEPPRSMQRLIKLFDELSRDPIMASGDSHAGGIGSTAAKALRMADQIEATSPFGGHGKTDLVDFLMDRHNVSSAELSDFSRWLVKWNDKRSQMEVLQAPEMFLGSKGLEEPTGLHWDTLSALSRRRQTAGQPESVSTERLVPPQTTSVAPGEKVVVKEVVVEKVRTQEVTGPRSVEVRVIESKGAAASAEVGKPDVLSQAWTRGRGAEMPAASGVPGEALAPAMSLSPAQQAVDLSQLIGATSRGLWTSNLQGGSMVSGLYYGQHTAPTPGAFTPVVPQAPPVLPPHPIPPPIAAPPARALADRGFQHADVRQQISPQQPAVATPTPVAQSKLAAKSQVGPDLAKAPSPGGPVPVPYPTIAQRAVGVGGPLMALTAGAAASNLIHRNLFVIPGVPGQAPVLGPPKDHAALLASLKPGQRPPVEAVSPLMGQMTLVAPPIKVASEQAERGGAAVSFDWKTLAAGAGAVDESSLANLKAVLPPGARAIYPALPPGSLGPQAVNLRLAPSLLGNLLQQGYGAGAAGIAPLASSMATGFMGGKADAMPLGGSLVPGKRPMGDGMGGILGGASDPRGALADAGSGQSKRGNALDFLGLPVRLAPSLGGRSELAEEVAMRSGNLTTPSGDAIRPQQFAPLRDKLFSSFGSVNAEPDKAAWKKEAPAFGLRDEKPTTLLAPDARVKPLKSSEDQPQLDTVEAKGARSLAVTPLENMPKPATGRVDSTEVGPRLGGSAPSMPMYSAEGADSGGFSSIGRIDAPSPSSGVPSLGGVQGAGPIAALTGAASAAAGSLGSLSMPPMPSLSPRSPLSARPSFQPLAVNAASAPAVPGFSGAAPLIGGGAGPTSIGLKPFLPSLVSGAMRSPSGPGAIPSPTAPPPISAPARPGAPIAISKGGNDEMEPLPSMPGSLPSGRGSNSWKMPSLPSPGTPHGPSITHAGSSSSLGAGALSAPSLELPSIGGEMPPTMRKVSSLATRAPDRLFAAPASGRSPARPSLAVQRADQAPQAPSSTTSRQQQTNSQVSAPEDGDKNAQVSLLANEVWAILKRRLVTEKERRGRW